MHFGLSNINVYFLTKDKTYDGNNRRWQTGLSVNIDMKQNAGN